MKRLYGLGRMCVPLLLILTFAGCAMPIGLLYTNVTGPLNAESDGAAVKVGRARATSVLGLVAIGDARIDAAANAAGISEIHHADFEYNTDLYR